MPNFSRHEKWWPGDRACVSVPRREEKVSLKNDELWLPLMISQAAPPHACLVENCFYFSPLSQLLERHASVRAFGPGLLLAKCVFASPNRSSSTSTAQQTSPASPTWLSLHGRRRLLVPICLGSRRVQNMVEKIKLHGNVKKSHGRTNTSAACVRTELPYVNSDTYLLAESGLIYVTCVLMMV